jgi:hypothetical protein
VYKEVYLMNVLQLELFPGIKKHLIYYLLANVIVSQNFTMEV